MYIFDANKISATISEMFNFQDRLQAFCPSVDNCEKFASSMSHVQYMKIASIGRNSSFPGTLNTKSQNIYLPKDMFHISFGVPTFGFDHKTGLLHPEKIADTLSLFRCSRASNEMEMNLHLMEIEQMLNAIYIGGYVFMIIPDKWRSQDMRYNRWLESNSSVVAKIELPQGFMRYEKEIDIPYRPEDQYGSKIDSGFDSVKLDFEIKSKMFLMILFKPYSVTYNLDGLDSPTSSRFPIPLEWAEFTYSPVQAKFDPGNPDKLINRFKTSDWYKMSVFQWNKMLKAYDNSTIVFGRTYKQAKIKDQSEMFVAKASDSFRQKIVIVDGLSRLKKSKNMVQVKITRSRIKIIGHTVAARCAIAEFMLSKDLSQETRKPNILTELNRDFDTVKFGLIKSLYDFGLIPCMLRSEQLAYEKRRKWINRQLTPIQRYIQVQGDASPTSGSKFNSAVSKDWDIVNDDIGLKATMRDQYDEWVRRATKMRLNSPGYTFGFQFNDIIMHAMKDSIVNGSIMGLGKTRELLFSAILRGTKRVLIVCPKRLIGTWQDEIESTLIPFARRVRKHWSNEMLSVSLPNIIEFASDCEEKKLTLFNIISYDKLKSTPRDGKFFCCPKCGFVTFSGSDKVDSMRCPGDPYYYDADPMKDKSCIGQLRRWKAANTERGSDEKLKYQKYKVHSKTGKKVHWNHHHPSRDGIPESECHIVDTRRENPYRDALTGKKPRPPLMKKMDTMYAKTKTSITGVQKKKVSELSQSEFELTGLSSEEYHDPNEIVDVPIVKRDYRKCGGKKFHAKWTFSELLRNRFNLVMVDEILTNVSNATSQRSQALNHLTAITRWTSTGTPMRGLPQRILNYINWTVDRQVFPDYRLFDSGGQKRFLDKYKTDVFVSGTEVEDGKIVGGKRKQIHKIRNPELFMSELSPFLIRRVRNEPEVAEYIPPVVCHYTDHRLPMDSEHRKFYQQMLELFKEWWQAMKEEEEGKKVGEGSLLAKLGWLIGAATNPHFIFDRLIENVRKGKADEITKKWASIIKPYKGPITAKMKKSIELIKDASMKKDKTIVFANRRQTLRLGNSICDRVGLQSMIVDGSVSLETKKGEARSQRHLVVQDFRFKGYDAMWAGIIALAEGMNIPEANHGIIYDTTWEPADAMQAIGRMIRPQQRKNVFVEFLMHEGTVDEYMIALCYLKKRSHDEGIDGISFDDISSEMIPDFRQYADSIVDGTEHILKRNMWLQVEKIKSEWEQDATKHLNEEEEDEDIDEEDYDDDENGN